MTFIMAERDPRYTCPQCGPDPRGGEAHALAVHTWPAPLPGQEAEELRAEVTRLEAENAFLQRQLDVASGELVRLRAALRAMTGVTGVTGEEEFERRLEGL